MSWFRLMTMHRIHLYCVVACSFMHFVSRQCLSLVNCQFLVCIASSIRTLLSESRISINCDMVVVDRRHQQMLIQEGVERVSVLRYEVGRYPVPKGAVPGTTGGGTRYQCKARYPVPVYVYVCTCRAVAVPTKGDGTRYEGAESDTRRGGYLVPELAVLGTIGTPFPPPHSTASSTDASSVISGFCRAMNPPVLIHNAIQLISQLERHEDSIMAIFTAFRL